MKRRTFIQTVAVGILGCCPRAERPVLLFDCLGTVFNIRESLVITLDRETADAWLSEYCQEIEAIGAGRSGWVPFHMVLRKTLFRACPTFSGDPFWALAAWYAPPAQHLAAQSIASLQKKGVECWAFTNMGRAALDQASLTNGIAWNGILCSDNWLTYKPNPRIYVEALERFGTRCSLVTRNIHGPDSHSPIPACLIGSTYPSLYDLSTRFKVSP